MSTFPQSRNERRNGSPSRSLSVGPLQRCASKVRADETPSIDILFRAYHRKLCTFAYTYVKCPDAAEDLVADVFARLWQQHLNGHTYIDPKRYLYTAVRNQALKHLAHERVVRNSHGMVQGEGRAPAMSQSPEGAEDELEAAQLKAAFDIAVDSLPARCREAFELYRCNGMTYPEIADIMNISARTVETHVGHARRALRQVLADWPT
jgi:RNA polymerase sigma-70 factor, ECF subfamily